ncbi:MAG: hypothetical protein WC607_00350 [Candidatus Micrarchaeia archaeon]
MTKKYPLPTAIDVEILSKCKSLEKTNPSKQDAATIKLIKSQLEDDWRKPLLKELNRLSKKYGK